LSCFVDKFLLITCELVATIQTSFQITNKARH